MHSESPSTLAKIPVDKHVGPEKRTRRKARFSRTLAALFDNSRKTRVAICKKQPREARRPRPASFVGRAKNRGRRQNCTIAGWKGRVIVAGRAFSRHLGEPGREIFSSPAAMRTAPTCFFLALLTLPARRRWLSQLLFLPTKSHTTRGRRRAAKVSRKKLGERENKFHR